MMHGKITYHQQVTYCGKPRCRRCREGIGHGPYWYAYQTVNGQTTRTYIGKNLPADVQPFDLSPTETPVTTGEKTMASNRPASTTYPVLPTAGSSSSHVVLRIKTLGQFHIEPVSGSRSRTQRSSSALLDAGWHNDTVKALLGYLICSPERKAHLEQVARALSPDLNQAEATERTLQALKQLRKLLGHPSVKSGQEGRSQAAERLRTEGDWLILAGQQLIWVDVDEFDALAHAVEQHESEQNSHGQEYEAVLKQAVTLAGHGEFLPVLPDAEWAQARRQVVHQQWIDLSLRLADLYMARADYIQAIATLSALLACEPCNESAVQKIMTAFYQQQRRPEAITTYREFEQNLREQYHAEPGAETQALYQAIRTGQRPPNSVVSSSPAVGTTTTVKPQVLMPFSPPEPIWRANQSTLVGRENELTIMRNLLREVRENAQLQMAGSRHISGIPLDTQRQPQFLLLNGVTGIGKTRLAEEVGREAQRDGWTVVWSRLYSQESNIPYRLWTEALRKLLSTDMDKDVLTGLSSEAMYALSTLPGLIDVLPLDALSAAHPPQLFSPENAQFRLYSVICDLLKLASRRTPLMLVLDDIQWADISSHQLLGHLARQLTGYPVVLLCTCRESELPRDNRHPLRKLILEMQREHTIKTLDIEPLSSEQIEQLVTSLSPLSEETVRHIQTYAAGNPFFAEEIALARSRSLSSTLPLTVSEALASRMKHLSEDCRKLLERAAILGGSFDFSVVCMMKTRQSHDDAVLSLLEEALDANVLLEEESGSKIVYHFWHPLVANHLYETVSGMRRARWHKDAAWALLQLHQAREEDVAAQIVLHLQGADADPLEIVRYAEMAGNNAFAVPAYAEAGSQYQLAVRYLEQAMAEAGQGQRLKGSVSEDEHAQHLISLLERLAECSKNSGSYEKASEIYLRLLDLHRQEHLQMQQVVETQIQALLWDEICWTWRYRGDIHRAWACCEQGEHILRAANVEDGPAWARLYYTRSNLYLSEGQYDQALYYAQESLNLFEAQHSQGFDSAPLERKLSKTLIQRTLDGDPVNLCRLHRHMGVIAAADGHLRQAYEHQRTALESFEQYNELRQVGNILSNIGYIHLKMGMYKQAEQSLQRALDLAERIGDGPLTSLVISNLGELNAVRGYLVEAEKEYTRALKLNGAFGDREYMSRWHTGLVSILVEQGKLSEARTHVIQALSVARAMKNQPCIGQALVALGSIRIKQAMDSNIVVRTRAHLLDLAEKDVQRALHLHVEAETRMKGEHVLAAIALERGEVEKVHIICDRLVTDAQDYVQLVEQARQLLLRVS